MNKQRIALPLLTMFVIVAGLLVFLSGFSATPAVFNAQAQGTVKQEIVVLCTTPGALNGTIQPGTPFPAIRTEPRVCQEGKITITVASKQWFANHIGGIVDMRISLLAPNSVIVDFRSLEQGTLKFDGTTAFRLAKDNPVQIQKEVQGLETLYTIDLRVQTFVPKPSVLFNIDLRYAGTVVEGTTTPDWKVLTTRPYMVATSNTRDGNKELLQGNMQPVTVAPLLSAQLLMYAGAILLAIWPVWSMLRWLNRKRPGYTPWVNETAWKTFGQVFREGNSNGFQQHHFRQISATLKGYLGVGTLTRQEINGLLKGSHRLSTIDSVLRKCDRVLYGGNAPVAELLSKDELRELFTELERIVPRPGE